MQINVISIGFMVESFQDFKVSLKMLNSAGSNIFTDLFSVYL